MGGVSRSFVTRVRGGLDIVDLSNVSIKVATLEVSFE